jgi:hypothetical protein
MEIRLKAFIKEYNQKGLVSGDKSHYLILHEFVIDEENIKQLSIAPTNKEAKITIEFD